MTNKVVRGLSRLDFITVISCDTDDIHYLQIQSLHYTIKSWMYLAILKEM